MTTELMGIIAQHIASGTGIESASKEISQLMCNREVKAFMLGATSLNWQPSITRLVELFKLDYSEYAIKQAYLNDIS